MLQATVTAELASREVTIRPLITIQALQGLLPAQHLGVACDL